MLFRSVVSEEKIGFLLECIGLAVVIFTAFTSVAGLVQVFNHEEPTAFAYGAKVLEGALANTPQGKDHQAARSGDGYNNGGNGGNNGGNGGNPNALPCSTGFVKDATGVCVAEKKTDNTMLYVGAAGLAAVLLASK